MKTHKIKIIECYADAVLCGNKTFEVRYNDRDYQTGDYIKFNVIDSHHNEIKHPLNDKTFSITYVLSGMGVKDNFVVLAIKEVKQNE